MANSKKLILLINLGSPHELSVAAIRKFLGQFLSDKRVVNLPRIAWYPILFGIILPLRAKKLFIKYSQIWHSKNVSPLVYYSELQAKLLQDKLQDQAFVDYAFCYGRDTIAERLKSWRKNHEIEELTVLPLYPQYSSSTTGAAFDQISEYYAKEYYIPKLKFINSFAHNPLYIKALAQQIQNYWQENGRSERLIVSFHSLPITLIENGDIYLSECQATYNLLCAELGLKPEIDVKLAFQSKFGKAKWIEPATDKTLLALAKADIKSVDVVCPGFVSDCLETLEEIAIQNRELFINAGGTKLGYIPCLNDNLNLIELLQNLVHNS